VHHVVLNKLLAWGRSLKLPPGEEVHLCNASQPKTESSQVELKQGCIPGSLCYGAATLCFALCDPHRQVLHT
jgi:hypothetical protein